jgi:hypothetical protein
MKLGGGQACEKSQESMGHGECREPANKLPEPEHGPLSSPSSLSLDGPSLMAGDIPTIFAFTRAPSSTWTADDDDGPLSLASLSRVSVEPSFLRPMKLDAPAS